MKHIELQNNRPIYTHLMKSVITDTCSMEVNFLKWQHAIAIKRSGFIYIKQIRHTSHNIHIYLNLKMFILNNLIHSAPIRLIHLQLRTTTI